MQLIQCVAAQTFGKWAADNKLCKLMILLIPNTTESLTSQFLFSSQLVDLANKA